MSSMLLSLILGCGFGLEPLNDTCPGGPDCWCLWDTAHEYRPPLDELGQIDCDTSEDTQ